MRASPAAATLGCIPIYDGSVLVERGARLCGPRAAMRRNARAVRFAYHTE